MGGGNAQKSATARARKQEKAKKAGGSQLKMNEKAMTLKCNVCLQTFMCTTSEEKLKEHWENKHAKVDLGTCFPSLRAS